MTPRKIWNRRDRIHKGFFTVCGLWAYNATSMLRSHSILNRTSWLYTQKAGVCHKELHLITISCWTYHLMGTTTKLAAKKPGRRQEKEPCSLLVTWQDVFMHRWTHYWSSSPFHRLLAKSLGHHGSTFLPLNNLQEIHSVLFCVFQQMFLQEYPTNTQPPTEQKEFNTSHATTATKCVLELQVPSY